MPKLNKFSVWEGYRPTPRGYEQSYHVRRHPRTGSWTVSMRLRGDTFFAIPEESTGVEEITSDVRFICEELGSQPGGVITINEFKQAIKPINFGQYQTLLVYLGRYPDFHVVFEDGQTRIDNSEDSGLETGTVWPYQKIGIRYRFRVGFDDLYMVYGDFYNETQISLSDELDIECSYLTQLLKRAKGGSGGVFYVNEHGLVFAPRQNLSPNASEEAWSAVYVGPIDYDRWLDSEMVAGSFRSR